MPNRICILIIGLLLFAGTCAWGQNETAKDEISAQEYEILRLALIAQRSWSSVTPETLAKIQAGADWLIPPQGIDMAPDLAKSFNQQNSKTYKLSEAFLKDPPPYASTDLMDKKQITLTRPGIDKKKRQAMVILVITYYYPEDVMNEGMYVFLEKKDKKWAVVSKASAWDIRMGPTP